MATTSIQVCLSEVPAVVPVGTVVPVAERQDNKVDQQKPKLLNTIGQRNRNKNNIQLMEPIGNTSLFLNFILNGIK